MTEVQEQGVNEEGKVSEIVLPKRDKLAIVGCSNSRKDTPFDKADEFEFWGVNNLFLTMPGPWTRWFEIHSITYDGYAYRRRGSLDFRGQPVIEYLNALGSLDIPVYMQKPWPMIPKGVIYPVNEIVSNFNRGYFTNSISWMIALGIAEGFQEIHVYGVDMAVDTEYFWQRPSCEYFIGIAEGKGIKFILPETCDLLKTKFLYGFQEIEENKWMKKVNDMQMGMQKKQSDVKMQYEQARAKLDQYTGAIHATHEMKKIWKNL